MVEAITEKVSRDEKRQDFVNAALAFGSRDQTHRHRVRTRRCLGLHPEGKLEGKRPGSPKPIKLPKSKR
jgi:hypothetical protein